MKKFYITTAIPYVNAKPHLGHALEFIQADVLTRYHKMQGKDVLLLSGSDENALKNVQAAEKAKVNLQDFIDKNANLFLELAKKLNVAFDIFQRGSDLKHHLSSQKLWELCFKRGDIYKKEYKGLYCVGCEAFYNKDELNNKNECFEHPGKKLEEVSEENYFFRLSHYQKQIIDLLEKDKLRIIPEKRKKEILSFLQSPLEDLSISRSNERAKNWGVKVPQDLTQRMYVWFDALNIYQSGVGFGWDEEKYKKWWPADIHIIGKGIIRFHAIYWPAFLISAQLPLPKSIFVHGYITVNGQKMSKTLGNIIDPFELVDKYGADAVRYFLLREITPTEDGDFTYDKFRKRYNSDLAFGLGNLVARVIALANKYNVKKLDSAITNKDLKRTITSYQKKYHQALNDFKFNEALVVVWELISFCDKYIEKEQPWKESPKQKEVILETLFFIEEIAYLLGPFLPQTSKEILNQIKTGELKKIFPHT